MSGRQPRTTAFDRGLGCAHEEDPDPAEPRRSPRVRCQEGQVVLSEVRPAGAEPLVLFCTDTAWAQYADQFTAAAPGLEVVTMRGDDTVAEADLARLQVVFFSGDAWPERTVPFIS